MFTGAAAVIPGTEDELVHDQGYMTVSDDEYESENDGKNKEEFRDFRGAGSLHIHPLPVNL